MIWFWLDEKAAPTGRLFCLRSNHGSNVVLLHNAHLCNLPRPGMTNLTKTVMKSLSLFCSAMMLLLSPLVWGQVWIPQPSTNSASNAMPVGGESEMMWYLPDVLGSAPAEFTTTAPEGFTIAESQICVEQIVAYDPFCLQQNWDDLCQEEYECCLGQDNVFRIGCDNVNACNYDPTVCVDDPASCVFCLENCYTMTMLDGEGNGWQGVMWTLTDSGGETAATGTLEDGYSGVIAGCLDAGCYTLHVESAQGTNAIQWTLNGSDAGVVTGGAGESVEVSFNGQTGCTIPWACNFNSEACTDDESCVFENNAPADMTAFNWELTFDYGCDGNSSTVILSFSNDFQAIDPSGLAAQWSVCQDVLQLAAEGAILYEGEWTGVGFSGEILFDESGCFTLLPASLGCTDMEACNFDIDADVDDASCTYPGCMNPLSCNFDDSAGCPAPCALPEGYLEGCTNFMAPNYNALATVDDGSCDLSYMCLIGTVYDPSLMGCVPTSCPGDFDYDGEVDVNDLLSFLVVYNSSCN